MVFFRSCHDESLLSPSGPIALWPNFRLIGAELLMKIELKKTDHGE